METEKLILSVFGYHFYGITDHPHKFVLFFIKVRLIISFFILEITS